VTFERVAKIDDVWEGEVHAVRASGKRVLLVCLEDGLRAYADRCAHLGLSMCDAKLEGHHLTCPAHGYRYDMRTGICDNVRLSSARLEAYPLRIEDGDVLVDPDPAHTPMAKEGA
jgi:nitrite reductase/ring-hydroxylating ferredoxin subunit